MKKLPVINPVSVPTPSIEGKEYYFLTYSRGADKKVDFSTIRFNLGTAVKCCACHKICVANSRGVLSFPKGTVDVPIQKDMANAGELRHCDFYEDACCNDCYVESPESNEN